ncbi:DUF5691 domain-containing protein [Nocardia sp. NPDC050406]|uniref:DUF5691 domain-containing protein n=1 Tax=Nocardia sp. NPDC050406 TaxID=3364318 RepID=UPI0037968117
MSTRWSTEQVAALAPDAASLTAARKLRGKWSETGQFDNALWGLCAGSGSRPYQTVIDLSGPAYKCSCPSRKFPCKHALGLLLTWAEGGAPETDAPADFAAEWLAGRAARAAKQAAPEAKSPRTGNPATADQRHARVTAGLADLDMWLADQIRTGLASADRSHTAFESVAARMVDAQAPGVALALRQLPRTAARADWPHRLLREYGRLHLLVTAHQRLDEIAPALRSSIRTHIGYPTTADAVRAEPAVRDHWMVLAARTGVDDGLYTRRVWLRGRATGRWALLLDHHYGSPSFPQDTPAPGFQVDAELHYYPAAAPLRAVWGERYDAPEPFTTIPVRENAAATRSSETVTVTDRASGLHEGGSVPRPPEPNEPPAPDDSPVSGGTAPHPAEPDGSRAPDDTTTSLVTGSGGTAVTGSAKGTADATGTIANALREHAQAIGADPFLRSWPVLLTEVVPVRGDSGWRVVETAGDALPVSVEDGEPWRMLGISGGHPITVIGEWTVDGLIPISVFSAGAVVDAVAADGIPGAAGSVSAALIVGGTAETGSTTEELVSTALVGTARRSGDTAALPAPVAERAAKLTGDAATALLETVALHDCFARGGVLPVSAERVEPAADDPRPLLPPAAAARLGTLLTDTSSFLEEWFAMAEPHDYRAPDALCSRLLERAKSVAAYREQLLRLAGSRGRWLAAQHPGWRSLVRAAVDDDAVWSHGRAPERRAWLARLRHTDPAAAREALTGSWAKESGPGKVELLAVLADGLSAADEPLLESALDDRRADVRRKAADLLACLPDSAFAHRMADRAAAWVSFGERLSQPLLTTTGPGVLDDAARRDGVGDSFPFTAYRADGSPDLAAEWLHRVVAATPLSHWEGILGAPEEAVRVPMAESLRGPMLAGWSDAALAQRNSAWARALFTVITGSPGSGDPDGEKLRDLFALQSLDDQVRHLRRLDSSWLAEIESLLRAVPHPWPSRVADHVLRLLMERARLSAARPGAPSLVPGSYRTLFRAAATHFPVTTLADVAAAARGCGDPYWEQAFDQLAGDLMERKTMLEELT